MSLADMLRIVAQFRTAKAAIKAAAPGEVVDAGVVKGLKLWGREIELPLQPKVVR